MSEHPPRRDNDDELEREREESTDLGYRDTEEERAYEEAEGADAPGFGTDDAAGDKDDAAGDKDDAAGE